MADLINNYFQNKLKMGTNEIKETLALIFKNSSFIQKYDVAGTYTFKIPFGVDTIYVSGIGGGGGGGGGAYLYNSYDGGGGGGGGAGSYAIDTPIAVVSGEELTVEVGAGGEGGSSGTSLYENTRLDGDNGSNGGDTLVYRGNNVIFSVSKGTGGTGGKKRYVGGAGGSIGGSAGMSSSPYTGGEGGSVTEFGGYGNGGTGGRGYWSSSSGRVYPESGENGVGGALIICIGNVRLIDVEWE